jgi:hypothetical protein
VSRVDRKTLAFVDIKPEYSLGGEKKTYNEQYITKLLELISGGMKTDPMFMKEAIKLYLEGKEPKTEVEWYDLYIEVSLGMSLSLSLLISSDALRRSDLRRADERRPSAGDRPRVRQL